MPYDSNQPVLMPKAPQGDQAQELRDLLGRGGGTGSIQDVAKSRAIAKALREAAPTPREMYQFPDETPMSEVAKGNQMLRQRSAGSEIYGDTHEPANRDESWEGDLQATPRDLSKLKRSGDSGTESFVKQFGFEATDPNRGPGYVPMPVPRKPWMDPIGPLGPIPQELPPGVTVRPKDEGQIRNDLSDPEDEEILNHIMNTIGKGPKQKRRKA